MEKSIVTIEKSSKSTENLIKTGEKLMNNANERVNPKVSKLQVLFKNVCSK